MLLLKIKRPSTLTGCNVRLSNLLISYCLLIDVAYATLSSRIFRPTLAFPTLSVFRRADALITCIFMNSYKYCIGLVAFFVILP